MHLKRLVVAAIFLPFFYLYIMSFSEVYFLALLVVAAFVAQSEFYSMYKVDGALRYLGLSLGIFMLLVLYGAEEHFPDFLVIAFILISVVRLFSKSPSATLYDISRLVVSLVYIPLLLSYQIHLRRFGPEWIIMLYACIWASDSMAYYIGSSFGKRKLYEAVSPNKTVAGAAGSVLGGLVGALFIRSVLINSLPVVSAVSAGMIIGGIAVAGDLVESMFKRDAGVKDSGGLIPGHGGVLDKIDSVLFAGPFFLWTLIFMGIIK